MKPHYLLLTTLIAFSVCTGRLNAADDDFPKVGNAYSITYSVKPEGYYWPFRVRIVKRGPDQWCLVDFERVHNPPHENPAPKDWDYKKEREERWINFSLLVAATDMGASPALPD